MAVMRGEEKFLLEMGENAGMAGEGGMRNFYVSLQIGRRVLSPQFFKFCPTPPPLFFLSCPVSVVLITLNLKSYFTY